MLGGATLGTAFGWTGFGAAAGGLMAAHGIDNYVTGFNQAWYGEEQTPLTAQVLERAGMSHETAGFVNNMASVPGVSLGVGAYCFGIQAAANYIAGSPLLIGQGAGLATKGLEYINRGAQNINASTSLNTKLSQLENIQKNAVRIRTLSDGRIRYYTAEIKASFPNGIKRRVN